MATVIISNGRGSSGSIETLLQHLAEYPLERSFEQFGNFIQRGATNLRGEPLEGIPGAVSFFGNFFAYSHVFNIVTDEPEVIDALSAAIALNQARSDYLDQPPPYYPDRLSIVRKRFSTTQGEVELFYDGERINQFGDKIELQGGDWRGYPDSVWHDVARRFVIERHDKARAAEAE